MSAPLTEFTVNASSRPAESGSGQRQAAHRGFFLAATGTLIATGTLVVLASIAFTGFQAGSFVEGSSGASPEACVLQSLITGNLAICLLWVWLDLKAMQRHPQAAEARGNLSAIAVLLVACSTIFSLGWAGAHGHQDVAAFAVFICLPTLGTVVPLLWWAAHLMNSLGASALALMAFVAASALAQGRAIAAWRDSDGSIIFAVNSYLIGLAVAAWLASWAVSACSRRTA